MAQMISRVSKWWKQVRCFHNWKHVRAVPEHWADIYRCTKCGKEVEEEYDLESI